MSARTAIEAEANALDLELFRAILRTERLADAALARRARHELNQSLASLRAARGHVRALMHPDDVKETA